MKRVGVSIYPDFYELEELKQYLGIARKNNCTRIYTCLLLGNYNFENGKEATDPVFKELFNYCNEIGIEVAADTTNEIFRKFGATVNDLKPFKEVNIPVIRIDGGFTFDEIIEMTNNPYGIKIEINASYITSHNPKIINEVMEFLNKLQADGTPEKLVACFNFYPRLETAHTIEYVRESCVILHKYNIEVGAFVASQMSPKDLQLNGNGVPTVEKHRYLPPFLAAQELFAVGVNTVVIGDSYASEKELEDLGRVCNNDFIEIPAVFNQYIDNEIKNEICNKILGSRGDQAENVIRSSDTRGIKLEPLFCSPRKKYDITLDNKNNYRYIGELQIILEDLGRAEYANVIGFIHPDGQQLLKYLKYENNKFKLIEYPM